MIKWAVLSVCPPSQERLDNFKALVEADKIVGIGFASHASIGKSPNRQNEGNQGGLIGWPINWCILSQASFQAITPQ